MPRYQEMLGELVGSVELAEGLVTPSAHEVLHNFNHPLEEQDGSADSSAEPSGVIAGQKQRVPRERSTTMTLSDTDV